MHRLTVFKIVFTHRLFALRIYMSLLGLNAFRAPILHFTDAPDLATGAGVEYFDDGILLIENGCVKMLANAEDMIAAGFDARQCQHFPEHLIMPGFIDSHIHYP